MNKVKEFLDSKIQEMPPCALCQENDWVVGATLYPGGECVLPAYKEPTGPLMAFQCGGCGREIILNLGYISTQIDLPIEETVAQFKTMVEDMYRVA